MYKQDDDYYLYLFNRLYPLIKEKRIQSFWQQNCRKIVLYKEKIYNKNFTNNNYYDPSLHILAIELSNK